MADSSCSKAWGMCLGDPRCQDTACQRHPALTCSICTEGRCRTPLACQVPLQELPVRIERRLFTKRHQFEIQLPTTRAGWGRVMATGLGVAGTFYILGAVGRHLGLF